MQPSMVSKLALLLLILALLLASVIFAGCTGATSPSTGGSPPQLYSTAVFFAPSVAYAQALRLISNLGLQPDIDCNASSVIIHGTPTPLSANWQPMGQRAAFLQHHLLLVEPTYLSAPADWLKRLQATPGVRAVKDGFALYAGQTLQASPPANVVVYDCPSGAVGTPSPATPVALTAGEAGTFARIKFTSTEDYDAALYAISDVGLQLADPCFIEAQERGKAPPWHPMGQEDAFATTHILTVQTNKEVTSSLWQAQLQADPEVAAIETPFTPQC